MICKARVQNKLTQLTFLTPSPRLASHANPVPYLLLSNMINYIHCSKEQGKSDEGNKGNENKKDEKEQGNDEKIEKKSDEKKQGNEEEAKKEEKKEQ